MISEAKLGELQRLAGTGQFSYAEMAEILNMNPSSVRHHMIFNGFEYKYVKPGKAVTGLTDRMPRKATARLYHRNGRKVEYQDTGAAV